MINKLCSLGQEDSQTLVHGNVSEANKMKANHDRYISIDVLHVLQKRMASQCRWASLGQRHRFNPPSIRNDTLSTWLLLQPSSPIYIPNRMLLTSTTTKDDNLDTIWGQVLVESPYLLPFLDTCCVLIKHDQWPPKYCSNSSSRVWTCVVLRKLGFPTMPFTSARDSSSNGSKFQARISEGHNSVLKYLETRNGFTFLPELNPSQRLIRSSVTWDFSAVRTSQAGDYSSVTVCSI